MSCKSFAIRTLSLLLAASTLARADGDSSVGATTFLITSGTTALTPTTAYKWYYSVTQQ
jgi:hypothetical protein